VQLNYKETDFVEIVCVIKLRKVSTKFWSSVFHQPNDPHCCYLLTTHADCKPRPHVWQSAGSFGLPEVQLSTV